MLLEKNDILDLFGLKITDDILNEIKIFNLWFFIIGPWIFNLLKGLHFIYKKATCHTTLAVGK